MRGVCAKCRTEFRDERLSPESHTRQMLMKEKENSHKPDHSVTITKAMNQVNARMGAYSTVVLDEAHRYMGVGTKPMEIMKDSRADTLIFITGTPTTICHHPPAPVAIRSTATVASPTTTILHCHRHQKRFFDAKFAGIK